MKYNPLPQQIGAIKHGLKNFEHVKSSKIILSRQIVHVVKAAKKSLGRPPLWPYHGTYKRCPECCSRFILDMYQRSSLRKGNSNEVFCSHECQLKRNHRVYNAEIGRNNRGKISATKLKAFEGVSTHYRKVNGRHEHRTVAEEMLGRPLKKGEIVHHKNGDKRDNRPCNLQVMTQSEHAKIHNFGRAIT